MGVATPVLVIHGQVYVIGTPFVGVGILFPMVVGHTFTVITMESGD